MANMTGHLSGEFDFYIVTRNNEYGETAPYTDTVADSWNDLMPLIAAKLLRFKHVVVAP